MEEVVLLELMSAMDMLPGPLNRSCGPTQSNAVIVKLEPGREEEGNGYLSGILAMLPLTKCICKVKEE